MADKLEAEEKQEALQQELIKRMDLSSFTAHLLDVEGATTNFDTNLKTGLSSKEAAARLEEHGHNELSHEEEKSLWERIIEQFDDILVQILLASATVSFLIALAGKLVVAYLFRVGIKCFMSLRLSTHLDGLDDDVSRQQSLHDEKEKLLPFSLHLSNFRFSFFLSFFLSL